MNPHVEQLHVATIALAANIDSATFEELGALVELRDATLEALRTGEEITEKDRMLIQEICQYDQLFVERMTCLRDEATMHLNKRMHSRVQKTGYDNANPIESYFIDKRK